MESIIQITLLSSSLLKNLSNAYYRYTIPQSLKSWMILFIWSIIFGDVGFASFLLDFCCNHNNSMHYFNHEDLILTFSLEFCLTTCNMCSFWFIIFLWPVFFFVYFHDAPVVLPEKFLVFETTLSNKEISIFCQSKFLN